MAESGRTLRRSRDVAVPDSTLHEVQVECFMVTGHADARRNILSMLNGGWGGYILDDVPSTIPLICLAIMLRMPWEDKARKLKVTLRSEALGEDQAEPFDFEFNPARRSHRIRGDVARIGLAPQIIDFPVPSSGYYEFTLHVDGVPLASTGFVAGDHDYIHPDAETMPTDTAGVRRRRASRKAKQVDD